MPMPNTRTVLLVDDEPLTLAAVRSPLVKKGYEVATATSGEEALQWLALNVPDLVILDVVMPGLSGFDVCRRIREDARIQHLPIIFLTARNKIADMTEGADVGSDVYLVKPVLAARLLNMVGMFLSEDVPLSRRRPAATTAG